MYTIEFIVSKIQGLVHDVPEKDGAGVFIPNQVDAMLENNVLCKVIARLKALNV